MTCIEKSGKSRIVGERGMCDFQTPSGEVRCEEWSFVRGECTIYNALPSKTLFTVHDGNNLFIGIDPSTGQLFVNYGKFELMSAKLKHQDIARFFQRCTVIKISRAPFALHLKKEYLKSPDGQESETVTAWWPPSKNGKQGHMAIAHSPLHSSLVRIFNEVLQSPKLRRFAIDTLDDIEMAFYWIEFWAHRFKQGFAIVDGECDCYVFQVGPKVFTMTDEQRYSEYHRLVEDSDYDAKSASLGFRTEDWKGFEPAICDFINERVGRFKIQYKMTDTGRVRKMKIVKK
jgi:hypothetical protein